MKNSIDELEIDNPIELFNVYSIIKIEDGKNEYFIGKQPGEKVKDYINAGTYMYPRCITNERAIEIANYMGFDTNNCKVQILFVKAPDQNKIEKIVELMSSLVQVTKGTNNIDIKGYTVHAYYDNDLMFDEKYNYYIQNLEKVVSDLMINSTTKAQNKNTIPLFEAIIKSINESNNQETKTNYHHI